MDEIYNSYINGQSKQMVAQIDAYGVDRFFIDLKDYIEDNGYAWISYAEIVVRYHKIKE